MFCPDAIFLPEGSLEHQVFLAYFNEIIYLLLAGCKKKTVKIRRLLRHHAGSRLRYITATAVWFHAGPVFLHDSFPFSDY